MLALVYQKACCIPQLCAEIRNATALHVLVEATSSNNDSVRVMSAASLNQTQKDAVTAIVAAHVPDFTFTEETVTLP